jgi:hypothetical protein
VSLGLAAEASGDWQRAAVLLSSALALFERLPAFLPQQEMAQYRTAVELAGSHSGQVQAPLTVDALVSLALLTSSPDGRSPGDTTF